MGLKIVWWVLYTGMVLVFLPLWVLAVCSALGHPLVPEEGSPVAAAIGIPVFFWFMEVCRREIKRSERGEW